MTDRGLLEHLTTCERPGTHSDALAGYLRTAMAEREAAESELARLRGEHESLLAAVETVVVADEDEAHPLTDLLARVRLLTDVYRGRAGARRVTRVAPVVEALARLDEAERELTDIMEERTVRPPYTWYGAVESAEAKRLEALRVALDAYRAGRGRGS